jgi:hypothetical protein
MNNVLKSVFAKLLKPSVRRNCHQPTKKRQPYRPGFECLEDRQLMTATLSASLLPANVASTSVVRLEAQAAASPITVGETNDFATGGGVGSLGNGASITNKGITYTLLQHMVCPLRMGPGVVLLEPQAAASPITVGETNDFATAGAVGSLGSGASITIKGVTYSLRQDTVYRMDPNQLNAVALSTGAPIKAFNVDANGAVYALQFNHQLQKFPTGSPQKYTELDHNVDSFALDGRGAVYTLSRAGNLFKFPTSTPNQYQRLDYGVKAFAVDPRGPVYTLSNAGNLWKFPTAAPGRFVKLDYGVTTFALGASGAIYTLSNAGNLWKFPTCTPGSFVKLDYGVTAFAIDPRGPVYTLSNVGNLWKFPTATPGQYMKLDYNVKAFAIDPWGAVYTLSNAGNLYKFPTATPGQYQFLNSAVGSFLLDGSGGVQVTHMTINDKIVAFCQSQMHAKVGGGECANLANEALRVAGADFWGYDPNHNGDYVWGTLVTTITPGRDATPSAHCQPGDIIQFQNVTLSNGWSASHHTAIVAAVDSLGRPTQVYEENVGVNGKGKGSGAHDRTDRLDAVTINLKTVTSGTIHIYRAVARTDSPGKVQFSVVNDTTQAQTVTIYLNGTSQRTMSLDVFNTMSSYETALFSSSDGGTWAIGINGHTVTLNNAGGYEVYTLSNGETAIRQL